MWGPASKCSASIQHGSLKTVKRLNLAPLFLQVGIKTENSSEPLSYRVILISNRDVNVMCSTQRQHKGEPCPGEQKSKCDGQDKRLI